MYRFNGHDQRLERMLESTLMVMEALEGYGDRVSATHVRFIPIFFFRFLVKVIKNEKISCHVCLFPV